MKKPAILLALAVLAFSLPVVRADEAAAAPKKQHFISVLRLVERLHDDQAWTKPDQEAVGKHFQRLKDATATGKVALAGRTMEPGDRTFGLVVFEAANADEAKTWAHDDPAVAAGVMTVDVRPFALVLERNK